MEFINEENHIVCVGDFLHHNLQPLFKLPPVFGPCYESAEVEGYDSFAKKIFRHIAHYDFLRKAFKVTASRISLKHGEHARRKVVEILQGSLLAPEALLPETGAA